MLNLDTLKQQYRPRILAITTKYGADNIRIFGSLVRGEASEDSDIDLLVRLRSDTTLLKLAAMERELRELLGHEVDIVSETAISKYLKDQILNEAVPL